MSYSDPGKPSGSLPFTAEELCKRFDSAVQRKMQWVTIYREAMQYVMPNRETFYIHTPGQKKSQLMYDSTAQDAADIFASRIHSTITPSWQVWSEFRAGSDIPDDQKEDINKALNKVNKIVFDYINHSNFTSQANECYLDLCIGTAAMLVERGEGDTLIENSSIPLSELFLEEGPDGKIQTNFRQMKAPARVLAQKFPNAEWSESISKAIADNSEKAFEVVMASVYVPKERKWYQVLFERGKEKKGYKKINQYHVEDTNPWIIPRWTVTSNEIYGRGPAIKKLPDIKTLNKMTEFTLRHAAMAVSGAYLAVEDGVINPYNIRIQPNTIIPVKAADSLRPLPMSGSPDYSELVKRDLVEGINKAFLANPMPGFNDPVRTATEISIRNSEMLKNAGAQLGRLKSEWVEPYMARVVDILRQEGKIPKIAIDGREVTLKHTSPLAKIEDQEEIQGFQQYIGMIAGLEAYSPGLVALTTKLESVPSWLAHKLGGFEDLVRTQSEAQGLAETVVQTGQAMAEQAGGGMGEGEVMQ